MILLILFSLLNCFADPINDKRFELYLTKIDEEKITQFVSPPVEDCPSENIFELMSQCMTDLCGNPQDVPNIILDDSNFDQYVDAEKLAPVENRIEQVISHEFSRTRDMINTLYERMKGDLTLNWNDEMYRRKAKRLFSPYIGKTTIDYEKPLRERISYDIQLPENATVDFGRGMELYVEALKRERNNSITTKWSKGIDEGVYTDREVKNILVERWNDLHKQYLEKKKKSPVFLDSNNIHSLVNDIQTHLENENYRDAFYTIKYLDNRFNPSPKINAPTTVYGNDFKTIIENEYEKSIFNSMTDFFTSVGNKTIATDNAVAKCKANLAVELIKEQKEAEEIKRMTDSVGRSFQKNVLPHYSGETQKALIDYFHNTLRLSTSSDGSANSVEVYSFAPVRKLEPQSLIDKFDEKIGKYSSSPPISSLNDNDLINLIEESIDDNKFNPIVKRLSHLCKYPGARLVWDSYNSRTNVIRISAYSCTHFDTYGKGILAHELGHAINAIASKKFSQDSYEKFREDRACINELYKIDVPPKINPWHDGDTLYTEEDMADQISYLATKDESHLFECSLLKYHQNGQDSFDIPKLFNHFTDNHSTHFLRLLRQAVAKGVNLSSSCQKVIDRNKDKLRFEPCF